MENLNGIKIIEQSDKKIIKLLGEVTDFDLKALLSWLKENKINFAIYDKFYPSPSDPGAYINYSRQKAVDVEHWSMTLGNHGWTGGIYMISELTILQQLKHLIKVKALEEITIEDVFFFSYYDIENPQKSLNKDREIFNLHKELD